MIKILGICSSPSQNGNTALLCQECLLAAQRSGAQIELINLAELKLQYCKGCLTCLKLGKCILPDDLEEIRRKMVDADGLILASPTYALGPNAVMKNFLDRIGLFNVYTSQFGGKYIIAISTAGRFGAKSVSKQLGELVQGVFRFGVVTGRLSVTRGWLRIEYYPRAFQKASELGQKLVNDISHHRRYIFQSIFKKLLHRFILRRVFLENIITHRENEMKAVFDNLIKRKIITQLIH